MKLLVIVFLFLTTVTAQTIPTTPGLHAFTSPMSVTEATRYLEDATIPSGVTVALVVDGGAVVIANPFSVRVDRANVATYRAMAQGTQQSVGTVAPVASSPSVNTSQPIQSVDYATQEREALQDVLRQLGEIYDPNNMTLQRANEFYIVATQGLREFDCTAFDPSDPWLATAATYFDLSNSMVVNAVNRSIDITPITRCLR